MNALVLYHLRKFCDKYGIDYQEIDDTLTYWENKEHLQSFAYERFNGTCMHVERDHTWRDREAEKAAKSQAEQYMKEHALSNYIMAAISGETVSEEVGDPPPPRRFSLAAYIKSK